jgi:hypothetical protein
METPRFDFMTKVPQDALFVNLWDLVVSYNRLLFYIYDRISEEDRELLIKAGDQGR